MIINQDYSSLLEQRECRGGCGVKFKVMPQSDVWYARSNCATYCKNRTLNEQQPIQAQAQTINKVESFRLVEPIQSITLRINMDEIKEEQEQRSEGNILHINEQTESDKHKVKQQAKPETTAKKNPERKQQKKSDNIYDKMHTEDPPKHGLINLEKSTKSKNQRQNRSSSNVVDRMEMRFQKLWEDCLLHARKLLPQKDQLQAKMDLAYLCLMDIRLHGDQKRAERIKAFAEALSLTVQEVEFWIDVRQNIWDRLSNPEKISRYAFEDILSVVNQIRSDMKEDEVQKIIEEKINGKYLTVVKHFDESLQNIWSFYEKFSLDLLPESNFEKTYDVLKTLTGHFRQHAERMRNRKLRDKKNGVN